MLLNIDFYYYLVSSDVYNVNNNLIDYIRKVIRFLNREASHLPISNYDYDSGHGNYHTVWLLLATDSFLSVS